MNFLQISYLTKMLLFFRATSLRIWLADDTSFSFTYEQKQQSIFQFWMQHNTSKMICQIQVSVQETLKLSSTLVLQDLQLFSSPFLITATQHNPFY